MATQVKLCGFKHVEDLDAALSLGVDAIGLNLVSASPRVLELPTGVLLCDAFSSLGGSGRLSNWEMAALLAKKRQVWLAGGLVPANVRQAIATVKPFGVDVASGIESAPAKKDHAKMRAF